MSKFTLEKSRYFPYFAWTLIIAFAIFVGSLTLELRHSLSELEIITQHNSIIPIPTSNPAS